MRIAVMMGGSSSERAISLVSGEAVLPALARLGHEAFIVDPADGAVAMLEALDPAPDLVFNALHGSGGEDGRIQAWLDWHGLRYTHSGMRASLLAFDKSAALALAKCHGITIAANQVQSGDALSRMVHEPMARPFVVKPVFEGSSIGVYLYQEATNTPFPPPDWRYGDAIIESFVAGQELTCAVLDGKALAVTELQPKRGFYDFDAKYSEDMTRHIVPAVIAPEVEALCRQWTERMHHLLGCCGITRCDFRFDPALAQSRGAAGGLHFLELNTHPGLTELSLVPEQAAYRGMSFDDLIAWIIQDALEQVQR